MAFQAGRLFRKFFLALFLAQVFTGVGIGFLIWLAGPEPHLPEPDAVWEPDRPPPPPGCPGGPGGRAAPAGPGGISDRARAAAPSDLPSEAAVAGCPPPPVAGAATGGPRPRTQHGRWSERRRHGFPFLPVGVGLVFSALFAFLLARNLSGPIVALREAFAEIGRGNFKVRLGAGMSEHPDELESLRTDFDASAGRLEALVEGQRRLLHDVSHEVRSPVARLQLALDLVRQQPQRAEELLARMEREVLRIDNLVEELLTLSRLEARAYGPLDEAVDLAELVQEIAADAGFEGQSRGVRVTVECPDPFEVRGHPELLHRAIENVVRNALNHTPEGSVVSIRATAGQPGVAPSTVVIEDQGAGVPVTELERMFQPFKRLGGGANGDGHGLGLAITREALAAHGGRAYAENRAEGGLRVVLELHA